jgi:carboxypeptidase Taq
MTTQVETAYQALLEHLREQALAASCQELLSWDELTRLPDGASDYRGQQIAWLAGRHHALATDPRIGEWLELVERSSLVADARSEAAVNVREVRRQYDRHCRLPRNLVEQLAWLVTAAQHHWKLAREQNDFSLFRPWLSRMVLLKREEALCLGGGSVPYDALMAEYEPGFQTADIQRHFAQLGPELATLLAELLERQRRTPRPARPELLRQAFDPQLQRQFCHELATAVGFDHQRGGIDLAVHPFTSLLGPADIRIALRFDEHDLREGIFGALHELGHALYDQSLPHEHHGTPLGEAASLSIHESQGRLWENAVGRSFGFWQHFLPRLAGLFPESLGGATTDDLWRAVNFVQPSLNRVRSDEVTYNLHILIRFELELALLSGDLSAAELPAAWNERYEQTLGIQPASDHDGCLQDGHWAAGMFGYFPTYTLGNLVAAQLFACAERDLGSLNEHFARGDFAGLRLWLNQRVYRHGKRLMTGDLVEQASGQPLDHRFLIEGLRTKHRELWDA